jgi:HEAT repeat protein
MDALIEIGEPAIPYLIKNILESNDDLVVNFSMSALLKIEGDDDIVQLRLRKAMESQTDEKKKARVQWILNLLVSHTRWPLGSMPLVK